MLCRDARVCSRSSSCRASSEASTTPSIVTARPVAASTRRACRRVARPTITGSAAPLAEIGATMLIVPDRQRAVEEPERRDAGDAAGRQRQQDRLAVGQGLAGHGDDREHDHDEAGALDQRAGRRAPRRAW